MSVIDVGGTVRDGEELDIQAFMIPLCLARVMDSGL